MSDFQPGDIVEVVEGIDDGGRWGGYSSGDVGVIVSLWDASRGIYRVRFDDRRSWYSVDVSEIALVDRTGTPVSRRIKKLHQRQTKFPFLSKEYVNG